MAASPVPARSSLSSSSPPGLYSSRPGRRRGGGGDHQPPLPPASMMSATSSGTAPLRSVCTGTRVLPLVLVEPSAPRLPRAPAPPPRQSLEAHITEREGNLQEYFVDAEALCRNYPLLIATWKIALALALTAGCTTVLKLSDLAYMTCLDVADMCKEVGLPSGVLNIVTALGVEAGAPLLSHPNVGKEVWKAREVCSTVLTAISSTAPYGRVINASAKPLSVEQRNNTFSAMASDMLKVVLRCDQVMLVGKVLIKRGFDLGDLGEWSENTGSFHHEPGWDQGTEKQQPCSEALTTAIFENYREERVDKDGARAGGRPRTTYCKHGLQAYNLHLTKKDVKSYPLRCPPRYTFKHLLPLDPIVQYDESCVIVSLKYAVEFRHRLHGNGAATKIIDLEAMKSELRNAGIYNKGGCQPRRVLDYIISEGGAPTEGGNKLHVQSYETKHQSLTCPADLAKELFDSGPYLGFFFADPTYHTRGGVYRGFQSPLGGVHHCVLVYGYRFTKTGLEFHVLENMPTGYGLLRTIHVDAFQKFLFPKI